MGLGQLTAEPIHSPAAHASFSVQYSPSSQVVPSFLATLSQTPALQVASAHGPALALQSSLVLHPAGVSDATISAGAFTTVQPKNGKASKASKSERRVVTSGRVSTLGS